MTEESPLLLFGRDGHLTDLAIDRYRYEDLPVRLRRAVAEHLEACPACSERLAEQARTDAEVALPPLPQVAPRRRRRWAAGAVGLALAAGLAAVVLRVEPPSDAPGRAEPAGIRLRGSGFDIEVWADRPGGPERLESGAAVAAGERLGFRVATTRPGYLILWGRDGSGADYPVYPPSRGDAAALAPQAGAEMQTLPTALRFDAAPGPETLRAVFCPEPFTWAEATTWTPAELRARRCTAYRIVLPKRLPEGGP